MTTKNKKEMEIKDLENIQSFEEHLLVIQDKATIIYKALIAKLRKSIKQEKATSDPIPGFSLHDAIAVGADSNNLYRIPKSHQNKKMKNNQWISSAVGSCYANAPTNPLTVICNSEGEGDLYKLLTMPRNPNTNLLIHSS